MSRLTLFWDNPNHTAAVLVALACVCWSLSSILFHGRTARFAVLSVEALLVVAIALTQSRGGMLAYATGLLAYAFLKARQATPASQAKQLWLLVGARLLVLGFSILLTPAGARLAANPLSDGSISSRITLWQGALVLASSNLWGWGSGNTGYTYLNLIQSPADGRSYTTMVNSFLEIASAFGLFGLAATVTGLLAAWLVLLRSQTTNALATVTRDTAFCWLISLSVAAFFTTMIHVPSIVGILGGAIVVSIYYAFRMEYRDLRLCIRSAGISGLLCVSLAFGFGFYLNGARKWSISSNGQVTVLSRATDVTDAITANFFLDRTALGALPIRELRGAIDLTASAIQSYSCSEYTSASPPAQYHVFLGAAVGRLDFSSPPSGRILLVAPTLPPVHDISWANRCTIVIPEDDESRMGDEWRSWAFHNGVATMLAPNVGQNVAAAFPEVWKTWVSSSPRDSAKAF